mmetsp:Transcript_46119/g.84493  ORF Transcript_46119/g.84493 Transcript_46119/m.84493 type:complete len:571 (+) Transcript_46119:51-1763(+)
MASASNSDGSTSSGPAGRPACDDSPHGSAESSSTSPRTNCEAPSPDSGGATSEAPDWRKQFLHRLAEGLDEMPRMELPSRKGLPPTQCESTKVQHNADKSASPVAEDPPVPSAELGPGFFAGVEALQRRMAQRRLSNKMRAGLVPGADVSSVEAATGRTSSFGDEATPKQGMDMTPPSADPVDQPETATVDRNCVRRGSERSASEAPRREEILARSRVDTSSLLADDKGGQSMATGSRARSAQPQGPLRDSELRRPRSGISNSLPYMCLDTAVTRDAQPQNEGLQAGDDLLTWAEEVLRKAKDSPAPDDPNTEPSRRPVRAQPQQSRAQMDSEDVPCQPRGPEAPPPMSPRAKARRRRAEELRDKMRRLTEESERERARLTNDEEVRRRRLVEEEERWRNRVNTAAEEYRANFSSNWSPPFTEQPGTEQGRAPCGEGSHGGDHGRSANAPASLRTHEVEPRSRESANSSEAAWSRVDALLETHNCPIYFVDIPWPASSGSITGITSAESAASAKKKLALALRRWHPDKWKRILDHVPRQEQQRVMEHVKAVAQRLLEEKSQLAKGGRVLR